MSICTYCIKVSAVERGHYSWMDPLWARLMEWRVVRQCCIHVHNLVRPSHQTAVCCGQHSRLVGQLITLQQNHQYIISHTITITMSLSMAQPCSTKPVACLLSPHLPCTHHHRYHHIMSRRSHISCLMLYQWVLTTLASLTLMIQHQLWRVIS